MEEVKIDIDKIIKDLKVKYPHIKMFHAEVPRVGHYIFRAQDMSDVKFASAAVNKFIDEKIESLGGNTAISLLPEEERNTIARDTDMEAGDISNNMTIKRCVLYPEYFSQFLEEDKIVSGVVPMLLEKIMEVSGWTDVEVTEI